MQNYRDTNNKIYALPSTEFEHFLPQGCVAITQAEADALNKPEPLTDEQKRAQLLPLSAWQVRKVLTQFNLRTQVETAIANADQATKDAWNYANEYTRNSALLNSMATALGMTSSQLDSMFEVGATL